MFYSSNWKVRCRCPEVAEETLWRLLPSVRRDLPRAGGHWPLPGQDEREQPDEARHHPPRAQTVHMERDCQAEAADLHPLSEGPGEKARGKHCGLGSVLTVSVNSREQ